MSQPAPHLTGGVPTPPFAFLPDPVADFTRRAARLEFLAAEELRLAPFLTFAAGIAAAQARLAERLGPAEAPGAEAVARAREAGLPLLDRARLVGEADAALTGLLAEVQGVAMPDPARRALEALGAAGPAARAEVLGNVLADRLPPEAVAQHLFAAAAAQVELARRAAALDPKALKAVATGVCPCCGGAPAVSVVSATTETVEGARYAVCAACTTRWNEVRVKCLRCGSLKGLSYRALDDGAEAPETGAPVKAECCNDCGAWVKILYQLHRPHLEPLADDLGTLGLDLRMQGGRWLRAGANPFLAGY